MIIYANQRNEIKDVDTTEDKTLTALEVRDEGNPFAGWSVAKICCYKVHVRDGQATMYTPYVDSRLLGHIDRLGRQEESSKSMIADLQDLAIDTAYRQTLGELGLEDEL